jgi:hypothetical protein
MKEYILSLDQGTTSSRAVLFNAKGEKVASVQKEYPQIFPGNGWVEHDPMDILESQLSSAREVIAKAGITAEDVAAIGIANQRETTILWDKNTGKPVYNAIVWQCRRTSEDCARMESQGLQKFFKENRKKYKWDKPHYKGFLIQCCDAATADDIKNRIKELDDDSVIVVLNREFNTDSLTRVKVERGLFVEGDNEKIDELVFKGAPVKADEKLPIAFVSGKLLKKMPEAYTDVRGQVTADYQTYLEKVWVKKLNKKYPVEIYEDVLKTVNRP